MHRLFSVVDSRLTSLINKLPQFSQRTYHLLAIVMVLVITLAYSLLLLHRYWQFEFFFVDNVYFHSALWKLSRGEVPMVTHPFLGKINIFGDHFHPVILFVAGLLRIFPWNETVLLTMSLTFGLSLYLALTIGFKVLRWQPLVFALVLAYALYLGVQNAMIYGFHEINFVPLFLLLAVYGIVFDKLRWYWVGFGLLLLTKESLLTVGLGLGIFVWFGYPKRRGVGVATILGSVVYYLLATKFIIPHFSHGEFLYGRPELPNSLPDLWDKLTNPPEKIRTFLVSMMSFGFLPLLNLAALPLVIQDFIVRYVFAIPGNVQYTLGFHYGIALAPILFLSSLWTAQWMQNWFKRDWLLLMMAVWVVGSTLYFQRFYLQKAPLLLTINPAFYQATPRNAFLWEFLSHVPTDGKIMTQNHLGLALSRFDVYLMAKNIDELNLADPKYVVYDLRPGQNPNNFYPMKESEFIAYTQQLITSGRYQIYYHQGDQYILEKVENN